MAKVFDGSRKFAVLATGPANIRSFLVRACCYDCLIALIDPFLPVNQGSAGWWKPAFAGARSCAPTTPSR